MKTNEFNASRYREALLSYGFLEAVKESGRFFRQETETTAFVVNIEDEDEYGVTFLYGFARIGNAEDFVLDGSDSETCHVRHLGWIGDAESEGDLGRRIAAFYAQYKGCTEKDIQAIKKERLEVFLSYFDRALQPLGFQRKGKRWSKMLKNERILCFDLQKSVYSDQYYLNVTVRQVGGSFSMQSFERVAMYGRDLYNWQLMTEEQIASLVDYATKIVIEPKLT